jgi:hypothetical protein
VSISVHIPALFVTQGRVLLITLLFIVIVVVVLFFLLLLLPSRYALSY